MNMKWPEELRAVIKVYISCQPAVRTGKKSACRVFLCSSSWPVQDLLITVSSFHLGLGALSCTLGDCTSSSCNTQYCCSSILHPSSAKQCVPAGTGSGGGGLLYLRCSTK